MTRPLVRYRGILAAIVVLLTSLVAAPAGAQETAVRAILFYSPTCPHCHEVMNQVLPPLIDQYGEQLTILAINTTQQSGAGLYLAVAEHFQVPQDRRAVPLLVVGDQVMVGSAEIPELLPGIIDFGLIRGGIDWPAVPRVLQALEAQGIIESAEEVLRRAEERAAEVAVGGVVEGGAEPQAPIQEEADTAVEIAAQDTGPPVGTAQPEVPDTVPVADEGVSAPVSGAGEEAAEEEAAGDEAAGIEAAGDEEAPVEEPEAGMAASAPDSVAGSEVDHPGAIDPEPAGVVGTVQEAAAEIASMSMADRFALDKAGNTVAVIVLVGMLVALALVLRGFLRTGSTMPSWPGWSIPALLAVGTVAAVYLSYVEITNSAAVCGPVGHCNDVQQSPYATLFGFLPVGVLGILAYIAMAGAWVLSRSHTGSVRDLGHMGLWSMALIGALFSVYLTFLEPFVIGASCVWCLTSAVAVTLILRAATPSASLARESRRA